MQGLQQLEYLKPDRDVTWGHKFLQVAAGGKLKVKPCDVKKFAPEPGVYVTFMRPPGCDEEELWQWTPVYLGKASNLGRRCASYLDTARDIFWCDTRPCDELGGDMTCKCKLFGDLADRGYDVGIL
jgi:hypothetical protein